MAKLDPDFLQKIKDAVNITDVVGEHVVLKKSGSNHLGLCPFHSERTPSFFVSEQKQLYHCYGCKKGGDLITFVREIHGVSFMEAVEELADRAGIPLPSGTMGGSKSADPEEEKRRAAFREKQAMAFKLNRFAAAFFHRKLQEIPAIRNYFQTRHVDAELQRAFYVGAAPDSWDALSRFLREKKAPLKLAEELGLIRPSTKRGQGETFDLFRGRAIFPVIDTRGKVVAFGGRLIPEAVSQAAENAPKYLNSPESFIFHKSRTLFGLYQAQKHIREKDEVILVEGYFDVLALWAAGVRNVVATCGTALSADHLQLLKRFCSRIVILFDGDQAGQSATLKSMELGLDQGVVLYGAVVPGGMDPDEFIFDRKRGGHEKFAELLGSAEPLIDSKIRETAEAARGGNSEELSRAIKQVASWLGRMKDPVGRKIRLENLEKNFGWKQSIVEQAIRQPEAGRKPAKPMEPRKRAPARTATGATLPIPKTDRILMLGWIHATVDAKRPSEGPGVIQSLVEARDRMPPESGWSDLFGHPGVKKLVERLLPPGGHPGGVRQKDWEAALQNLADSDAALDSEQHAQVRSMITEVLLAGSGETGRLPDFPSDLEIRQALVRNINRLWARFSQRIKKALTRAELNKDGQLQAKLMKDYLDVQRKMKEFNTFYDES